MPSPFPCNPVICECSWKKTQIEKNIYVQINEETQVAMDSVRLDMIIVAIYCYLEKEIYRTLYQKFPLLWNMHLSLSLLSAALQ